MTNASARNKPQGRLWRLCRKELRETLRDRRTILTLVLMPLLLYPLLGMTLQRFLLSASIETDPVFLIGVASEREGAFVRQLISNPRSLPPREIKEASGSELARFDVVGHAQVSPDEMLEQNQIHLAARVAQWEPPVMEITAMRGDETSLAARRILVERLQWLKMADAEELLSQLQPEPYQPPLAVRIRTIGTEDRQSMLATVIPLVLVLMTITGAVYPAIDLTAGERERGTIEALIASPISRGQILIAKYVAVVTVALLTALVNLAAMFVTLWASGLLARLSDSDHFPLVELLQILGLLVLFSGFFSALLLSLTSFAKSFKEAQAYLIPLMLLAITPGILSLMPGVELTGPLAIVPLVNIVLLARDLLSGGFSPGPAIAAIVSTFAYAVAAIAIAARLFGSDAVLRGSELSIGSLFRRPDEPSDVPTPSAAALVLAVIFPVYYVVSNRLAQLEPGGIEWRLTINAMSLTAVFGGIPLLAAWLGRDRFATTFRLRVPQSTTRLLMTCIGAAVMGLGLWALAHEVFVIADQLGIGGLDVEKLRGAQSTLELLQQAPTWLVLVSLALTPAIVEELCFRGYLFSALRSILSPWRTIVVSSALFGVFHVLTGSFLLLERFFPTAIMGLFLGWLAWRSGSVYPGMVLHAVHNGFLNLVAINKDRFANLGLASDDTSHLPLSWLAIAGVIGLIGIGIAWSSSSSRDEPARDLTLDETGS
ncbi:MAG: ABC transporter permease subunit/CPBP intramembrane protease [Planctomycetaceae bacterium]